MSETIESRLSKDPKLLAVLKAWLDDSVKTYVDNGLLPQSIADEITENTTGRDVLKWVLNQTERDLPPLHDNRPDYLDARICALRYSGDPVIKTDGFVKIIPTKE